MKFVNIKDNTTYSGLAPYIHWFPGQQSIDLVYTTPLIILTTDPKLTIEGVGNDVIKLIEPLNNISTTSLNDFLYVNIKDLMVDRVESEGFGYNGKFLHIIYFTAQSEVGAEIIDTFKIETEGKVYTIKVGADFYNEDETLKINASNLGIHIPDSIQKAIYESDVHEESIDNILINRKLKELLSNYWDMMANRGSYKSLLNSLKWFEYGDLIRLREIWMHENRGSLKYDDRELSAIMNEKYKDAFNNFYKTTSFAIYLALQNEAFDIIDGKKIPKLDSEKNPELEQNIFQWTINDLALKMSLLGNFYETYFMPIHTELMHCSIEDKVFSNNIKILNSTLNSYHDIIACTQSFDCIVNDGKDIVLGNVNAFSYDGILFAGEDSIIGVKGSNDETKENIDNLKYYNGIGCITPITCKFEIDGPERISFGRIIWNGSIVAEEKLVGFNKIENNICTIKFNLLVKEPKNKLVMYFLSTTGKTYTKVIDIFGKDPSYIDLEIYKINHKKEPLKGEDFGEMSNTSVPMFDLGDDGELKPSAREINYYLSNKTPFFDTIESGEWIFETTGLETKHQQSKGKLENNITPHWFNLVDDQYKSILTLYANTHEIDGVHTLELKDSEGVDYASDTDNLVQYSIADLVPTKSLDENILYNNINRGEFALGMIYKISNDEIKNYNEVKFDFNIKYLNTFLVGDQIFCASLVFNSKELFIYDINKGNVDYIVTEEFKQNTNNEAQSHTITLKYDHDKIEKNNYIIIYIKNKIKKPLDWDWLKFSEISISDLKLRFDDDGVALNNFVVIYKNSLDNFTNNKYINENYFLYQPQGDYSILISKHFYDNILNYINKDLIVFQDWRYIDNFHEKTPLKYDTLEECTIHSYDNLYITPRILIGESSYPLKYSNKISNVTWKFVNKSKTNSKGEFNSVQEPFISSNARKPLDPGFYDVEFSYNINGTDKTIRKNSAFLKKD